MVSPHVLFGGVGNDRLSLFFEPGGAAQLFGGAGNDSLSSAAGSFDGQVLLDGGSGVDTLVGGEGRDIFAVDNRRDVIKETYVPEFDNEPNPRDEVRSSTNWMLANRLEDLTLTGQASIGVGNAAANRLTGNKAANVLNAKEGRDTLDGGSGADRMIGGSGNDTYYVDHEKDAVAEAAKGGSDRVVASASWRMLANVENLTLNGTAARAVGNASGNQISGNAIANTLLGMGGHDSLGGGAGDDSLDGGRGIDRLNGGAGKDWLDGGGETDTFAFSRVSDSAAGEGRDRIAGFRADDRIDLAAIDARTVTLGNQAFSFVGDAEFSGVAGQLRFAGERLQGDVNGDRVADFEVRLIGVASIEAENLIL